MAMITETLRPELTVESTDAAEIERIADELVSIDGADVDSPGWIAAARHASHTLPLSLRRAVGGFRREPGRRGFLLVRGLEFATGGLAPTPTVAGSAQRTVNTTAAVLMLVACELGDPIAYSGEKSGALVHDVVPVPGMREFQGNAGSVALEFHIENAFHPLRPDYLMLLCLRPDRDGVAALRTACIREVGELLTETARRTLFSPEFVTEPPPSFGSQGKVTPPRAVLTGAWDDPDICVDFAATTPLTPRAEAAMAELRELLDHAGHTVKLALGDLVLVDNRVAVHGRTAYEPRYDGLDRWLQRIYVAADLRRSRDHRPADGCVLNS